MLLTAALLLSLGQSVGAEASADFAVRITYGTCWNESVDTARRVFSRTIRYGVVRTARFTLTTEQQQRLHALVNGVGIFDYPTRFEPVLTTMTEPATDFTIEVRSGGRRHVVQWADYGAMSPEATRLRTMLREVREFFVALPSVQRLQATQIICL